MDPKKTGKTIQTARKALGMTQRELAEKLYISDKAVSKWERGLCYPDISVLLPLTEILEISVYDLLEGDNMTEKKNEVLKPTETKKAEPTITKEQMEQTMADTIRYSSNQVQRNKKKYFIIALIVVLAIAAAAFGFVRWEQHKASEKVRYTIVHSDKTSDIGDYTEFAHDMTKSSDANSEKMEGLVSYMPLDYEKRTMMYEKNEVTWKYGCTYQGLVDYYEDGPAVRKQMVLNTLLHYGVLENLNKFQIEFKDTTYKTTTAKVQKATGLKNLLDLQKKKNWYALAEKVENEKTREQLFQAIYGK